jgi:hypothetical protein
LMDGYDLIFSTPSSNLQGWVAQSVRAQCKWLEGSWFDSQIKDSCKEQLVNWCQSNVTSNL